MRVYLYQLHQVKDSTQREVGQILADFGAHKVLRDDNDSLDVERIDAVIVNGNEDLSSSSYVVALAVAKKKPLLFLLQKGSEIPSIINDFKNDEKMKKLFFLDFYTPENIANKIGAFIQKAEGDTKEVPSIKFTLRITPSMERYLQWKSNETGVSKADFLRAEITNIVQKDQDFQS